MSIIKCDECGKDVSDKSASCVHCGAPISKVITSIKEPIQSLDNDEVTFAHLDDELRMQTNFLPRSWEIMVIDKSMGTYIKSAINVDCGHIYLTNRRIVFCGQMGSIAKLAILGGLYFLTAAKPPKIHFQLLFRDILQLKVGKHGFAKTFIALTKNSKEYKFQVNDYDKWINAISANGVVVDFK